MQVKFEIIFLIYRQSVSCSRYSGSFCVNDNYDDDIICDNNDDYVLSYD